VSSSPHHDYKIRYALKINLIGFDQINCAVDMRFAWAASEKEAKAALTKKLKMIIN